MRAAWILYTNYRGETAWRKIMPRQIVWDSDEYHAREQWLLKAHDIEKGVERRFALEMIKEWRTL